MRRGPGRLVRFIEREAGSSQLDIDMQHDAQPQSTHADDDADEPMGGDPACWLHLFEDEDDAPIPPPVTE